jgi:hypothetical protein
VRFSGQIAIYLKSHGVANKQALDIKLAELQRTAWKLFGNKAILTHTLLQDDLQEEGNGIDGEQQDGQGNADEETLGDGERFDAGENSTPI